MFLAIHFLLTTFAQLPFCLPPSAGRHAANFGFLLNQNFPQRKMGKGTMSMLTLFSCIVSCSSYVIMVPLESPRFLAAAFLFSLLFSAISPIILLYPAVMAAPDTPPKTSPSLLRVVSLRQGFMIKVLYEGFYDFSLSRKMPHYTNPISSSLYLCTAAKHPFSFYALNSSPSAPSRLCVKYLIRAICVICGSLCTLHFVLTSQ